MRPDANPEDVTLVVPCYNVADTVSRALSAIDQLDPPPATVICIDDGSTDGTKAIIEDHDVRLIEHDRNRGLGTTLNTALSNVETALVAKVDADIVVPPDWLAAMCRELEVSGADFVQGRFDEEVTTAADWWRDRYPSPRFPNEPRRNHPINGSNIIANVAALRAIDGWDEQFRRAFDDIDVMERLIEAGYEVYYTPAVQTTHIRTDTISDVLHTAWAYHNDPATRGKPTTPQDVFHRLPEHIYLWGASVYSETKKGRFELAWISFLRLFFHVYWDIDHVRNHDRVRE